jgi:hypothetical protein
MTAGFCADLSADTAKPQMDIAIRIGNDVIGPLPCEKSLFRAAISHDAVNVGTSADDHRDNVLRMRKRAHAFNGGAID